MLTSSAGGADETLREERQCWICMGDDPSDLGGLIAPCSCKGSMNWVHRECLDTWRVSATSPENFTNCRNCGFRYEMVVRRSSVEELQQDIERLERQKRFKRDALVLALSAFSLSQVMLFALAASMLAVDPHEGIVVLFNLQERAPVGEASFVFSLKHHKASYYLGALALSLLLFGLVLSVRTCIGCYQGRGTARNQEIRERVRAGCCTCCDTRRDRLLCATNSRGCILCCTGCDCGACVGNAGEACSLLGADCSGCSGLFAGCSGDAAPVLIFCCGMLLLAMVAFGAFYLLFMVIAWCVTKYRTYMQLRELRDLVGEYIVKDLSEDAELQAMDSPSVGPQSFFVPGTGEDLENGTNDVEQRMMRDLQHAFRLDAHALAERLGGGENVAAQVSPREAVEPDQASETQPAQAPRQHDIEGN